MVKSGIDVLLENDFGLKYSRIGMVTNNAAKSLGGTKSRVELKNKGFNLVRLFSPEHGITNLADDGVYVSDTVDVLTNLPIVSLYGDFLRPKPEDISDLDVILFDIPDIGTRFYTFLWTMTYVMEACAECQIPLIILDRPNPLSGNLNLSEGPFLDEERCSSFIGRWSIPLRHSCTLGELALYFNHAKKLSAKVEVVKCDSWSRKTFQIDWGIAFEPTSPAIQEFESALIYPGLGLLEATNLSECRGTNFAFQGLGVPWLENENWSDLTLEGCDLERVLFTPTSGKYKGEECYGVKVKVTNCVSFKTVKNGLKIIKYVYDRYPDLFKWATYPTRANPSGENHLDLLLGVKNSQESFKLFEGEFTGFWDEKLDVKSWKEEINSFLLYS